MIARFTYFRFSALLVGTLVIATITLTSGDAHAASFTVTKTSDTNDGVCDADCSLREAITAANATPEADSIAVPAGTYIALDLPVITDDVTIRGEGAKTTIIDGGEGAATLIIRDFLNPIVTSVIVENVTIQNGSNGIRSNPHVTLTVNDVTVRNFTQIGINVISGNLVVNRSAIHGGGVGIDLSKAVWTATETTAFLTNVTMSGNSLGLGVSNTDPNLTQLAHVTITSNDRGLIVSPAEVANIRNSIIADNTTKDCILGTGIVTSLGNNLDSDGTCTFMASGDLPNTNPLLGPLQDNGGPTPTHALLSGSPAIDAVPTASCLDATGAALDMDQRGVTRPQGTACDSGAFESPAQAVPALSTYGLWALAVVLTGFSSLMIRRERRSTQTAAQ